MALLREQIDAVACHRCNVLIHGETGTGKELVARCVHAQSKRRRAPFIAVDCTTLPDTLFESQLFGHVKGSFTGAEQNTLGFVRAADGGTIFLDEIGELPLAAQAKLLRCIQERVVTPVGSTEAISVNVRLVAATHRDLEAMVHDGKFREDLFYRLNVAKLEVPPLRDRAEDIAALAQRWLDELAELYDEPGKRLSPEALAALTRHGWSGNVRELNNALEHAFIFAERERIEVSDLPACFKSFSRVVPVEDSPGPLVTLEEAQKRCISRALRVTGGNQSQAARLIGVERHRLRRLITLYELEAMLRP